MEAGAAIRPNPGERHVDAHAPPPPSPHHAVAGPLHRHAARHLAPRKQAASWVRVVGRRVRVQAEQLAPVGGAHAWWRRLLHGCAGGVQEGTPRRLVRQVAARQEEQRHLGQRLRRAGGGKAGRAAAGSQAPGCPPALLDLRQVRGLGVRGGAALDGWGALTAAGRLARAPCTTPSPCTMPVCPSWVRRAAAASVASSTSSRAQRWPERPSPPVGEPWGDGWVMAGSSGAAAVIDKMEWCPLEALANSGARIAGGGGGGGGNARGRGGSGN